MMNELIISVEKSTRMVDLPKNVIGNDMENLQEKLIFKFTDEFVNGQARLEYKTGSTKNYIVLLKENNTYTIPLKNVLIKEGKIEMQLVITENEVDEEIPVFKSNVFYLYCNKSINAVDEAPSSYELWIETANAKLNLMDEALTEVDNLNINVNKIDTTTTVEITKKDGTTKTVNILDGIDGQNGQDGRDGIDGQNGQDGRDGIDGQNGRDGITPTIGDNGNWYLGDTDTGKPSRGVQGEQGANGQDGYTPVKGVDYFTSEDIANLNIPTKTSDLTNDSGFLTEHQDISGKQNITDNTLTTNNKTIPTAINEVNSIARGATQAVCFSSYQQMINGFNILPSDFLIVGQNVMIITLNVPDLWISSIESTSQTYTYTSDSDFTNALATNGYIQVGYYKLSALETQKVDLTNYVTFDNFATSTTPGVVITNSNFGVSTSSYTKNITAVTKTYDQYQNGNNAMFVGKGTLENVITGKNLESANNKTTTISSSSTDTQYPSAKCVYDLVGNISTVLASVVGGGN